MDTKALPVLTIITVSAHPNGLESTLPSVRCLEDTMVKQLCPQEQTELQGFCTWVCLVVRDVS